MVIDLNFLSREFAAFQLVFYKGLTIICVCFGLYHLCSCMYLMIIIRRILYFSNTISSDIILAWRKYIPRNTATSGNNLELITIGNILCDQLSGMFFFTDTRCGIFHISFWFALGERLDASSIFTRQFRTILHSMADWVCHEF